MIYYKELEMKNTVVTFREAKGQGKLVVLTAYDYSTARVMDAAGAWRELPGHDPDAAAAVEARVVDLVAALRGTGREVVLVTNEVGQGIVPATASGRLFRDTMGVLNARVAAVCDEVWLVVAGLPLRLA